MPALLRPRHETFCQEYHRTENGTVAAERAGYQRTTAANQAYRLLQRPDIQGRVTELAAEYEAWVAKSLAERRERLAVLVAMGAAERDTLLTKLDPVYDALLQKGDYKEVMNVITLQAEIAGHLCADDAAPRRARRGVRPRQNASANDD